MPVSRVSSGATSIDTNPMAQWPAGLEHL